MPYTTSPNSAMSQFQVKTHVSQTKRIIKLTANQVPLLMSAIKGVKTIDSTYSKTELSQLYPEKVCGLFNHEIEYDDKLNSDTENITEPLAFSNIQKNRGHLDDMLNTENEMSFTQLETHIQSETVGNKCSNNKMKITINSPKVIFSERHESETFGLNLTEEELNKLMTPRTEKLCLEFLHSDSNSQKESSKGNKASASSDDLSTGDLEKLLQLSPSILESIITNENPFFIDINKSKEQIDANKVNIESIALDHRYSVSLDRAVSSVDMRDESQLCNQISQTFTFEKSITSKSKKQRVRGIYRAEDVTNDFELKNYIERRKKNNISSKISRANKKNHHKEMDLKSDTLEKQNKKLGENIIFMHKINDSMKEYLKEMFLNSNK